MGRFQFLKEKKFYLNLIIILVLCVVLLWLTFRLLDRYTRHDKVYTMPDFVGQDFRQVKHDFAKDFHFILIDSVYPKGQEPGSIYQQDPLPGSKVKKGRNVYAIIVAETPEKTMMPNLKNLSLRQAIGLLESSGLDVDHLEYQDYSYKNNIIEQLYDNQPIAPETELVKGSKITLRVGIGQDKHNVKVPNLIGRPAIEAKRMLNLAGMNLGKEVFDDNDSLKHLIVKRMNPGPNSGLVKLGTYINLTYQSSKNFDLKKEEQEQKTEDSIKKLIQLIESEIDTITENIETTDYEEYEDDF